MICNEDLSLIFSLTEPCPVRADKLISDLTSFSRERIAKNIEAGNILLNDVVITKKSFRNFKRKDIIEIEIEPLEELSLEPQDVNISVVFENDDFIIVNKPAGLVVHPAPGHPSGTLMNGVIFHLKHLAHNSDNIRPGLVHRIDKDTSGLLVIAKNSKTFEELATKFAVHDIKRTYYALVWGHLKEKSGTVETFHGRDRTNRLRFSPDASNGRKAVTHFAVEAEFSHSSLVKLNLETGRTHQIRMHMKHIGHPIINDELYGGIRKTDDGNFNHLINGNNRQLLHAAVLGFNLFGSDFYFESQLPDDFNSVLTFLNNGETYALFR